MVLLGIRLLSFAAFFCMRNFLTQEMLIDLFALLYSHYALGALYAGTQIHRLGTDRALRAPGLILAAAVVLGTALLWRTWLYNPFVGLHLALSEVYVCWGGLPATQDPAVERHNLLRLAFYFSIFATLVFGLPFPVLVAVWAACAGHHFWHGFQNGPDRALRGSLPFDALAMAGAAVICWSGARITAGELVFYHVFTWMFFPLVRLEKTKALPFFIVAHGALAAGFMALSIFGHVHLEDYVTVWGSAHIVLTLGTSRMNPGFLRRIFYPTRMRASAS